METSIAHSFGLKLCQTLQLCCCWRWGEFLCGPSSHTERFQLTEQVQISLGKLEEQRRTLERGGLF